MLKDPEEYEKDIALAKFTDISLHVPHASLPHISAGY
jgi:hypothetical protein